MQGNRELQLPFLGCALRPVASRSHYEVVHETRQPNILPLSNVPTCPAGKQEEMQIWLLDFVVNRVKKLLIAFCRLTSGQHFKECGLSTSADQAHPQEEGRKGGLAFVSKAVAREKKANPRVAIFNSVRGLQRGAMISSQLADGPQRNLSRNSNTLCNVWVKVVFCRQYSADGHFDRATVGKSFWPFDRDRVNLGGPSLPLSLQIPGDGIKRDPDMD